MPSLVVTAALLAPAILAASQAITSVGSSDAEACFEAARDQRRSQSDLVICNQALSGVLASSDAVATHVNRGIIHALRADYAQALKDYDKAISLNPGQAEAFLNKGLLLIRVPNQEREALEAIDRAIAMKTMHPALAHFARAIAHEGLGDLDAAYRDYRQAASLDPDWILPAQELRRFRTKS